MIPDVSTLTVYSRADCGYCLRLKGHLRKAGVAFDERPIEDDEEAAAFVASVNGGNAVVPTVVHPDGEVMTNPEPAAVIARVAAA